MDTVKRYWWVRLRELSGRTHLALCSACTQEQAIEQARAYYLARGSRCLIVADVEEIVKLSELPQSGG